VQICLITALTIFDFDDPEATIRAHKPLGTQLGVLCLAASAATHGHRSTIIDLDAVAAGLLGSGGKQVTADSLFEACVHALAHTDGQLFGFSSICSSYPLTLRLAAEAKRLHPRAYVVLGGPQATVVDTLTLEAFPWVDAIVRGEADWTLPRLIDAIDERRVAASIEEVAGITFRRNGGVVRNPDAALIANLDMLPLPAFEMDPQIKYRKSVELEVGRGCPYRCTFCSTNDFFRRRARFKSTNVILEQMKELHERYGVTSFSLVHDMFTVDRKRIVEFAEALLESGSVYQWSCSARTDRVDDELLALMAKSGCVGIFFGVETGSSRLQRIVDKGLDLGTAWEAIRSATAHRMKTAVALITGFPEEERDDLRDTIHFFVQATRLEHAEPQLCLLAPLAETPIEKKYRDLLVFDHIYSHMSQRGWREDPKDLDLIKKFARVFPNFYAVPTLLPRGYIAEARDFVDGMAFWFRWLPIALVDTTGDLLCVFDGWIRWHAHRVPRESQERGDRNFRYYCSNVFAHDLLAFVGEAIDSGYLPATKSMRNVLEYEKALCDLEPAPMVEASPTGIQRASLKDRLRKAEGVVVRSFTFDLPGLLDSLRYGQRLRKIEDRSCWIATLARKGRPIQVVQLSEQTADLILFCNGEDTVEQVVDKYCDANTGKENGRVRKKAAFAGLSRLYEDGLLEIRPRPKLLRGDNTDTS
jgi:radical SAM superfamily enzyme YgiQ (UPF0313 family)